MVRLLLVAICCAAMNANAQQIDYQRQIQPIFDRHCVECHSGWFPQGGLGMESMEDLYKGGTNGRALIPGQPDKGRLINMMRIVPGRFTIMPPGPAAVSVEEFELVREWIKQGAK